MEEFSGLRSSLPHFQIMTEDWFPYQFYEGTELRGISVDLMDEMLKRVGSSQTRSDIQLFPWARAYHLVRKKEHTVLFSMTRTTEREKQFRWVGPIFQNTTYLITLKKKNIKISSSKDLEHYRFGTIRDDASEIFLSRLGVNQNRFYRNSTTKSNLRLLHSGRIDFIVSGQDAFESDIKLTGLNPDDFEAVFIADVSKIWIAFYRDTEDWMIQKFQKSLDDIKDEGVYDQIFMKYGEEAKNPEALMIN